MIKSVALGLLLSLSLCCPAQRKSQLCRIGSGPLAGMLEQAQSTGFVGSPCSDTAGNRGFYVSSNEQTKNYDRQPGRSAEDSVKAPAWDPEPASVKIEQHIPSPAPAPSPPSQESTQVHQPIPAAAATVPAETWAIPRAQKPAPHAATVAASSPPGPAQQVHLWFEALPEGSVKYSVPTNMVLGESYSATATLHPPGRTEAPDSDGRPLKVSTYMRIVLAQPDNPDTFEIQAEPQSCKFVSIDADTNWTFLLKPILPGDKKHLSFSAYVVYGVDDNSCSPENLKLVNVLSETETVTVAAITPQRARQQILVSFLADPAKWFKFILPGGAGFAVIGGLIAWWRKRGPRHSNP